MNRVFSTLLIVCIFSVTAKSQVEKGTWLLSGNISFSSTNYNSDAGSHNKHFDLSVYPHVGYFLADKIAAGLNTGINYFGSDGVGSNRYDSYTDFNLGPFVRYYLLPVFNQINIVTEGSYQLGFFRGNNLRHSSPRNTYSLSAGPAIFFNETAGIEFLVGYTSQKYKDYSGRNNTIQISIGVQINLKKND